MSETKIGDWILILILAQVSLIILKLSEISEAATWSWLIVFSPTWFPVALAIVILSFYLLIRTLFPEKKKRVMYTSKRWQERLAELHSKR